MFILTLAKYKLKIPKILDLPSFVFHNNDKFGYSIVIRNNNDKYYHYLFNKINIIDNDFFEQKINHNTTYVFYKQI